MYTDLRSRRGETVVLALQGENDPGYQRDQRGVIVDVTPENVTLAYGVSFVVVPLKLILSIS